MLLNKKESKFKQFHRVNERISELYDLIRKAPYKPLENKIFVGHWRFFQVRKDVLRSSIGEQVQQVVDACNHWVLGKKNDGKSYRTSSEIISYGPDALSYYVEGQLLRPLTQEKFDKSGFNPSFERKWFKVKRKTISYGSKNVIYKYYFPQVSAHMLEWKYKAAYITEIKTREDDYESEMFRLNNFMEQNDGWKQLHRNYRDEWDMSLDKKAKLLKIKDLEIRNYSEDI